MKRAALIGCGGLGAVVADNLEKATEGAYRLTVLYSRSAEKREAYAARTGAKAAQSLDELIAQKPDIVIETAGVGAVREGAEKILAAGIDLVIVSIGALVDKAFYTKLEETARRSGARLYLASGAVGGFDALRTYALMGLTDVSITSLKAPESLEGAPGLNGRTISTTEPECVFEGGIADAIAGFPKNVNVAVATALAADFPETRVLIKTDPAITESTHRIEAAGPGVRTLLEFASEHDPANPRSSTSTAWSILALLKNIASPVVYF